MTYFREQADKDPIEKINEESEYWDDGEVEQYYMTVDNEEEKELDFNHG